VDSPLNVWVRRLGIPLLLAMIALWLFPGSVQVLGPFLGLSVWAAAVFGYIFIFLGIPFLVWIIARSVYRVFLRPYVRARHIRMLAHQRLLREAAERPHSTPR
jgi:hypothetical protein